ncbi:MAG: ABC transporter permease, partial [Gammaproteobacteria bacterium]|nr:ABC transporter permease [Gammaproteobacteria bacterium]
MAEAPSAALRLDPDRRRLILAGPWTLAEAPALVPAVDALAARLPAGPLAVDASAVTGLDTAGALLLLRALRPSGVALDAHAVEGLDPAAAALLRLIASRLVVEAPIPDRRGSVSRILWRLGKAVVDVGRIGYEFLGFVGLVLARLARTLTSPRRLRLTSTVFHMEEIGLDAVPIVALLTFLVGAVVAFVGATALRDLGAEIFTVELVSISFLREFGVLLTAILLAGRSGSAFAAQIGSMKSREELDAIQAIGLDPVELLVIPRLVALLVMLPILTFIAMLAGILGGGLVSVL